MKIGIVSDVHSNIKALEETFKYFEKEKVEKIICIGDVIGIGPFPKECIDFLIANENKILSFVRGNHENYLIKGLHRKNHNDENAKPMTDEQMSTHYWNHSRLGEKEIEYIKKLKEREILNLENVKIVIEHYPMDENNIFKKFKKNPSEEEIVEMFEKKDADVYLFGHTHSKYYLEKENKLFINPGSLGCPIYTNSASAGILEVIENKIKYTSLNINYDMDEVINEIKKLNYPLCDNVIEKFYKNS